MDIQRTVIRRYREIRKIDETCAVALEEVEITRISELSEKAKNTAKPAKKEKKSARRKSSKNRRTVRAQKLKRVIQKFWKWCLEHKKAIVSILICGAVFLNPGIKEISVDERLMQFLQLVLSLL